eukprot:2318790-Prymnesium_polylepis.1
MLATTDADEYQTTIEYVHIRAHSACVAVGDHVRRGQKLCESGDAGFCPTAHLHIEAHRTPRGSAPDPAAPSVPIAFELGQQALTPVAGLWYAEGRGLVEGGETAGAASVEAGGAGGGELSVEDEEEEGGEDSSSSGGWETCSDDD